MDGPGPSRRRNERILQFQDYTFPNRRPTLLRRGRRCMFEGLDLDWWVQTELLQQSLHLTLSHFENWLNDGEGNSRETPGGKVDYLCWKNGSLTATLTNDHRLDMIWPDDFTMKRRVLRLIRDMPVIVEDYYLHFESLLPRILVVIDKWVEEMKVPQLLPFEYFLRMIDAHISLFHDLQFLFDKIEELLNTAAKLMNPLSELKAQVMMEDEVQQEFDDYYDKLELYMICYNFVSNVFNDKFLQCKEINLSVTNSYIIH